MILSSLSPSPGRYDAETQTLTVRLTEPIQAVRVEQDPFKKTNWNMNGQVSQLFFSFFFSPDVRPVTLEATEVFLPLACPKMSYVQ